MPSNKKNPSRTKKSTPPLTPLGRFAVLPRELRDHIYFYICNNKSPFDFPNYSSERTNHKDRRKWLGKGLSMLRVSTAIREELSMVLFSKGIFKVYESSWRRGTLRSEIPFVDHISNIVISLDLYALLYAFSKSSPLSDNEEENISKTQVDAISYFGETSRKRNTCIIEFRLGGRRFGEEELRQLLSSPVMHALAGLTGFKTVQLTLFTRLYDWVEGSCPETDPWVLDISRALESTLGSFTITHEIRAIDAYRFLDQRVTFHPPFHPSTRGIDYDDHNNNNAPCLEPPPS